MKDIEPRFFDTENKILAHLEWEAIRVINFDGNHTDIADAYPKFEQPQNFWMQKYFDNGSDEHHGIKSKITRKEYQSLDDFYEALKPILKPKPRGKMLKDKKKRTSQKEYQRDTKGEAFIDNDPLFAAAAKSAFALAEAGADASVVVTKASELASEFNDEIDLTEAQIAVLCDYIQQRIDKHQKLDIVESKIIDEDNKNLYFMWGKIKREYPKGDTFTWTTKEAAAKCGCSRTNIAPIMKKLEKLGAITLIQPGKAGANSPRAALYRRDA